MKNNTDIWMGFRRDGIPEGANYDITATKIADIVNGKNLFMVSALNPRISWRASEITTLSDSVRENLVHNTKAVYLWEKLFKFPLIWNPVGYGLSKAVDLVDALFCDEVAISFMTMCLNEGWEEAYTFACEVRAIIMGSTSQEEESRRLEAYRNKKFVIIGGNTRASLFLLEIGKECNLETEAAKKMMDINFSCQVWPLDSIKFPEVIEMLDKDNNSHRTRSQAAKVLLSLLALTDNEGKRKNNDEKSWGNLVYALVDDMYQLIEIASGAKKESLNLKVLFTFFPGLQAYTGMSELAMRKVIIGHHYDVIFSDYDDEDRHSAERALVRECSEPFYARGRKGLPFISGNLMTVVNEEHFRRYTAKLDSLKHATDRKDKSYLDPRNTLRTILNAGNKKEYDINEVFGVIEDATFTARKERDAK